MHCVYTWSNAMMKLWLKHPNTFWSHFESYIVLTLLFLFFCIFCIFLVDWCSWRSPHLTIVLFLQKEFSVGDREQLSVYILVPPEPLSGCWGRVCLYSDFLFPPPKRDRWRLQSNANKISVSKIWCAAGLVSLFLNRKYHINDTDSTYNTKNDTNWRVKQCDIFVTCIYHTCSFYEPILYN